MKNEILVSDKFRKNSLSLQSGGVTVTVVEQNGLKKSYTNVKHVDSYTRRIKIDPNTKEILVNGEVYWKPKD